jgi:UDP-N-acetylmuramoylalanine--D-glutamate ligase
MCYLLLGCGISNQAVKAYLEKQKIAFLLHDDHLPEFRKELDFNAFTTVVKSPGISNENWIIDISRKLNKEIITDLELFYRLQPQKNYITVTGTNGKTTTVKLLHALLPDHDLGGNVGTPLFCFIDSPRDVIIEASSYMLEYTRDFHSRVNVFLNITPNHLNHHCNFKDYCEAKFKLIQNLRNDDFVIYNYDDEVLRNKIEGLPCRLVPFSLKTNVGVYFIDGAFYYQNHLLMTSADLKLQGMHNYQNIAAALAVIISQNISQNYEQIIKDFLPIEHRIEYLGKYRGAKVYNDSKATNYRALRASLLTFSTKKLVLVCGGMKAKDDIAILDDALRSLEYALIYGENREEFALYFRKKGIPHFTYNNLERLLEDLDNHPQTEILLFSPGSVSYDQFRNFEERGLYFKFWYQNKQLSEKGN